MNAYMLESITGPYEPGIPSAFARALFHGKVCVSGEGKFPRPETPDRPCQAIHYSTNDAVDSWLRDSMRWIVTSDFVEAIRGMHRVPFNEIPVGARCHVDPDWADSDEGHAESERHFHAYGDEYIDGSYDAVRRMAGNDRPKRGHVGASGSAESAAMPSDVRFFEIFPVRLFPEDPGAGGDAAPAVLQAVDVSGFCMWGARLVFSSEIWRIVEPHIARRFFRFGPLTESCEYWDDLPVGEASSTTRRPWDPASGGPAPWERT